MIWVSGTIGNQYFLSPKQVQIFIYFFRFEKSWFLKNPSHIDLCEILFCEMIAHSTLLFGDSQVADILQTNVRFWFTLRAISTSLIPTLGHSKKTYLIDTPKTRFNSVHKPCTDSMHNLYVLITEHIIGNFKHFSCSWSCNF